MFLVKFVFLVFLFGNALHIQCTSSIESVESIESKWSNFELAIKNRFKNFFDKKFVNSLQTVLNHQYEKEISGTCKTSLIKLIESLGDMKLWAIKMFDASAKIPASGLLDGTVTDLGQYDECLSIKIDSHYTGHSQTGQYCKLRIRPALPPRLPFNSFFDKIPQLDGIMKNADRNHSQWLTHLAKNAQYFYFVPILLGICTPSDCSSKELNQILSYWIEKDFSLEAKIEDDGCETLEQVNLSKKLGTKQYVAIGILSIFGLLVVLGSLVDALNLNLSYHSLVSFIKRLIKRFNMNEKSEDDMKIPLNVNKYRLFGWLKCFSFQQNLSILATLSRLSNDRGISIDVLHGIKVFAMSWVILGHTHGLLNPEIQEKVFISTPVYSDILSQPFLNATLSVNVFFAISGLLTSLSLLMNRDKMKNSLCFFMAFVFRLFRLLPPYIGLICITMIFGQFRRGPLFYDIVQKPVIDNCEQSYWTNFIFLNNFLNTQQMCLMHTWYLSVDIQFFIFGLVLFYIFLRNKRNSFIIMLASSILATLYCILVTYFKNYPPTILATGPAVTERWNYILDFYYKPWCHLSSYTIGFYFGYALYLVQINKEQDCFLFKIYSNAILRFLMNILMFLLGILTLLSTWPWNSGKQIPQLITAIYASTFRFCWSLSLLWFIYVMTIQRKGLIYQFLTWPGWLPISRVTYSAFLFHPIVIWMHFGTIEHRLSSTHLEFIRFFAANFLLSILLALISSLIFESPILSIQKLMYENYKKSIISSSKSTSPESNDLKITFSSPKFSNNKESIEV